MLAQSIAQRLSGTAVHRARMLEADDDNESYSYRSCALEEMATIVACKLGIIKYGQQIYIYRKGLSQITAGSRPT
jgi:hypothetical protein